CTRYDKCVSFLYASIHGYTKQKCDCIAELCFPDRGGRSWPGPAPGPAPPTPPQMPPGTRCTAPPPDCSSPPAPSATSGRCPHRRSEERRVGKEVTSW